MEWGLLVERKIWFNPIYGWVVHGSPWIGWYFHMLIRDIILSQFMYILSDYVGDIMVELPWFLCWLFVRYMLVMWCILLMALDMFWWMYKWFMNEWNKKCYCSYYERALDLLGDSQIIFRLLWSYMHSWPVAYTFTICLKKGLSWIRHV